MNKLNLYVSKLLIAVFFTLMVLKPTISVAEKFKHYISDQLVIVVRDVPSNKGKIIARLISGQEVYLEEDNREGWSKIKFSNKVGWVVSGYLLNKPVASIVVTQLRKKNLKLIRDLNNLKQEVQKTKSVRDGSLKEVTELESDNFKQKREIEFLRSISGKELELREENVQLANKIKELEDDFNNESFKANEREQSQNRKWFMAGGGIIIIGILLGRFLRMPNFRRRHRNSL